MANKMLDNCTYNKIKILYQMSCLLWFIKKHAIHDASQAGDRECLAFCEQLESDLQKYIEQLKKMACK